MTLNIHGQLVGNPNLYGIPIYFTGVAGVQNSFNLLTDASGFFQTTITVNENQGGFGLKFLNAEGNYITTNRYFDTNNVDLDYNTQQYCLQPFSTNTIHLNGHIDGAPAGVAVFISLLDYSSFSDTVYTNSNSDFTDSFPTILPSGQFKFRYNNPNCNGYTSYGRDLNFNTDFGYQFTPQNLHFCDTFNPPPSPLPINYLPKKLNFKLFNAPIGTPFKINNCNWHVSDTLGNVRDSVLSDSFQFNSEDYNINIKFLNSNNNPITGKILHPYADSTISYQNYYSSVNPYLTIDGWVSAVDPVNPNQILHPFCTVYLIRNFLNIQSGDSIVADSTYTDQDGYYRFTGRYAWDYSVKACVNLVDSNYLNFFPTYSSSISSTGFLDWGYSVFQGYSNTTQNFNLVHGNYSGGPGFISGVLQQGAGKSNTQNKVGHKLVYLLDNFGNPIQYCYTNSSGAFQFNSLALGSYQIVVDYFGKICEPLYFDITENTKENIYITFTIVVNEISSDVIYQSINSLENYSKISIFPNPAKDIIHINNTELSQYQVDILNVNGELVKSSKSNSQNTTIEVSDLSAGLYFILINDEKGNTTKRKVVIF